MADYIGTGFPKNFKQFLGFPQFPYGLVQMR